MSRSTVGRDYFEIVDTLEDNNKKLLVNFYDKSYPTLFEVDIYTGRKKKLSTSPAQRGDILLDEDKVVRAAWGENTSNESVFYYRRSSKDDWELHSQRKFGDGAITPLSFTDDGKNLIVLCSINNPITGVCKYYPESKELEEITDILR